MLLDIANYWCAFVCRRQPGTLASNAWLIVSFTSDSQVFEELDAIAGSTDNHDRKTIIQFVRSKDWVIEELEDMEKQASEEPEPVVPTQPNIHIVFESSSSESGNPQPCTSTAPALTKRQARKMIYINWYSAIILDHRWRYDITKTFRLEINSILGSKEHWNLCW